MYLLLELTFFFSPLFGVSVVRGACSGDGTYSCTRANLLLPVLGVADPLFPPFFFQTTTFLVPSLALLLLFFLSVSVDKRHPGQSRFARRPPPLSFPGRPPFGPASRDVPVFLAKDTSFLGEDSSPVSIRVLALFSKLSFFLLHFRAL